MSLILVTAAVLSLKEYDQLKLAHFLERLPENVVSKEILSLDQGRKVIVNFPENTDAFHIRCESSYFGSAPVPSYSECTVEIDVNHQDIEKNYDEIRIKEKSEEVSSALYSLMAHTSGARDFRAGYWDEGTDFNGRSTNIFHFLFKCSEKECEYRFSQKVLK